MSYFYDHMYGGESGAGKAGAEKKKEEENKKKKRARVPYPHNEAHCSRKGQRKFTGDRAERQRYLQNSCDKLHSSRTSANEKKRLTREQATRRAFVKGTHGFFDVAPLHRRGHSIQQDQLKRVKHGRYFLDVKRPASVAVLAWNQALNDDDVRALRHPPVFDVKSGKTVPGDLVLAKKEGTKEQKALYTAVYKKYKEILGDLGAVDLLSAKEEEEKESAQEHNDALYRATGGHNSYVWRVAKFQVNAKRDARKEPRNFKARKIKGNEDAKETKYYREIERAYKLLMQQRAEDAHDYAKAVREYEVHVQKRKGKPSAIRSRRTKTQAAKKVEVRRMTADRLIKMKRYRASNPVGKPRPTYAKTSTGQVRDRLPPDSK
jgi:hypothetical protein